MKQKHILIVLICISLLGVLFLSGCQERPDAKILVLKNTSTSAAITGVQISQYVSSKVVDDPPPPPPDATLSANLLKSGETIAAGESREFLIAPSSKTSPGTTISVLYSSSPILKVSKNFLYEYEVDGENERITASFDGSSITINESTDQ